MDLRPRLYESERMTGVSQDPKGVPPGERLLERSLAEGDELVVHREVNDPHPPTCARITAPSGGIR